MSVSAKFQLPRFHESKRNYASGGWPGGWVAGWVAGLVAGWLVPCTFYSHIVVQLASLQDFKPSGNSQVGPSVAKMHPFPSSILLLQ